MNRFQGFHLQTPVRRSRSASFQVVTAAQYVGQMGKSSHLQKELSPVQEEASYLVGMSSSMKVRDDFQLLSHVTP